MGGSNPKKIGWTLKHVSLQIGCFTRMFHHVWTFFHILPCFPYFPAFFRTFPSFFILCFILPYVSPVVYIFSVNPISVKDLAHGFNCFSSDLCPAPAEGHIHVTQRQGAADGLMGGPQFFDHFSTIFREISPDLSNKSSLDPDILEARKVPEVGLSLDHHFPNLVVNAAISDKARNDSSNF